MSSFDYWYEALSESLESVGCLDAFTKEQLKEVANDLRISAEMESESCGYLNITNPLVTEMEDNKRKHQKELERLENRDLRWRQAYARKLNVRLEDLGMSEDGDIQIL